MGGYGAFYRVTRAGITQDIVTAVTARQLYEAASGDPESQLEGALPHGYTYWVKVPFGRIRVRVKPLTDDQVPADMRALLERDAAGGGA